MSLTLHGQINFDQYILYTPAPSSHEMLTSIMRQYKLNRSERKFVAATYDSQLKKCLKDPVLTTESQIIKSSALIATGLILYAIPPLRGFGKSCIISGIYLLGSEQILDLENYLIEKGYLSNKDHNIFRYVLEEMQTK